MTSSIKSAVFFLLVATMMVTSSNAKRSATPKKPATVPNMNDIPSSSFWKAKYGDYEISQEGFPFNFVMPAV